MEFKQSSEKRRNDARVSGRFGQNGLGQSTSAKQGRVKEDGRAIEQFAQRMVPGA